MWLVICSKICLRSVFPNNINYTERKKYNENESQKKTIDLNSDGKIDSMDMYLLIQIILKE